MSDGVDYVALYDYEGEGTNELRFKAGDVIVVTEENESGWWVGYHKNGDGTEGFLPKDYVEKATTMNNKTSRPPPPPRTSEGAREKVKSISEQRSPLALKKQGSSTRASILKGIGFAHDREGAVEENYYAVLNLRVNPNAKTRFGLMANNMGEAASIACLFLGIAGMYWGNNGVAELNSNRTFDIAAGAYIFALAFPVFIFERWKGSYRTHRVAPFRGIIYILLSGGGAISLPTALAAGMLFMTGVVNIIAWVKKEEYIEPEKKGSDESSSWDCSKYLTCSYYTNSVIDWVKELRQQSKVLKYLFVFVYLGFNIGYIVYWADFYAKFVKTTNDAARATANLNGTTYRNVLTDWYPMAKMFGNLLDINAAFILFPVARSVIRYLYNISTDQTTTARCARAILQFIPLDKAIQFHKMCAALVVIGTIFHTWAHYMHYADVPKTYDTTFGATVWVTGVTLILIMHVLYSSSFEMVRRGKFELFWYTHHLFILFFLLILFHGKNSLNPNYWKWFIFPGTLYLFERIFREYRSRQPVGVVSVTHMDNPNAKVLCLELEKTGPIQTHQEGQYVFIRVPICSYYQWHPFTISSAPQTKYLTLHIRNMGDGTWTDRLQLLFKSISANKPYHQLFHYDGVNLIPQWKGPDGNNLVCVDGPMAAPTQHLGEYGTAVIVGAGIGVTPLRATLQSIVWFRFKRGIGQSFPDNAYCIWIVNHRQVDAYRFMVRTLKEAEDEMYDMRDKQAQQMNEKNLQIHVFVTSFKEENAHFDERELEALDDLSDKAIWGPKFYDMKHDGPKGANNLIQRKYAPFSELDIFRIMKNPKKQPTQIGDIIVHRGRPNWDEVFGPLQQQHVGQNIGVMFCGAEVIAHQLKVKCGQYTNFENRTVFVLHKENF